MIYEKENFNAKNQMVMLNNHAEPFQQVQQPVKRQLSLAERASMAKQQPQPQLYQQPQRPSDPYSSQRQSDLYQQSYGHQNFSNN